VSTISQPLSREPVELSARERLTARQRAELLDRQHNLCPACGETLVWAVIDGKRVYGPMIDEHLLPLWLGGPNDLANRALYCVPCAKAKTRKEARERGKVLRLERDSNPATRRQPVRKMRGRGFTRADPLKEARHGD